MQTTYQNLISKHLDDFSVISKPTPFQKMKGFELKSKVNINVWTHSGGHIYPIRVSKTKFTKSVDLLIVVDKNNNEIEHRMCIVDLSRCLNMSNSKASFICRWCVNNFSSQKVLDTHKARCQINSPQGIL